MTVYRVRAYFDTPVVFAEDIHLDGLLMSAHPDAKKRPIDRSMRDCDLPRIPVPILRMSQLGHKINLCTAAETSPGAQMVEDYTTKRRDGQDFDWLSRSVHLGLGPGKNRMRRLLVVVADYFEWLAWSRGGQGIKKMLRRLRYVGSWRSAGYGVVKRWEINPTDLRITDVLIQNNVAKRHLPLSWCSEAAAKDFGRVKPPYWLPNGEVPRVRAGTHCHLKGEITRRLEEIELRDSRPADTALPC